MPLLRQHLDKPVALVAVDRAPQMAQSEMAVSIGAVPTRQGSPKRIAAYCLLGGSARQPARGKRAYGEGGQSPWRRTGRMGSRVRWASCMIMDI